MLTEVGLFSQPVASCHLLVLSFCLFVGLFCHYIPDNCVYWTSKREIIFHFLLCGCLIFDFVFKFSFPIIRTFTVITI